VNWVVDQTYDEGQKNLLDAVKLCYELGLAVNDVNSMGITAVMGAANRGSDEIIEWLVSKGARLDVKDNEGRTSLTWAEGVFLATHPAKAKTQLDGFDKEVDGPVGAVYDRPYSSHWERKRNNDITEVNVHGRGLLVLTFTANGAQTASPRGQQGPAASASSSSTPALLTQYCITCHNQRAKTAGLTLDTLDYEHVGKDAATWEKVVRKIETGMMPPSGARRPERAMLDAFASEVETRLDRAAALSPNPGTPALHRLNRTEYANAIRDLLALDVDVTGLLPADDATDGFDNIADALGTSPSLIQGYISAAMKISRGPWAIVH